LDVDLADKRRALSRAKNLIDNFAPDRTDLNRQ